MCRAPGRSRGAGALIGRLGLYTFRIGTAGFFLDPLVAAGRAGVVCRVGKGAGGPAEAEREGCPISQSEHHVLAALDEKLARVEEAQTLLDAELDRLLSLWSLVVPGLDGRAGQTGSQGSGVHRGA